MRFVKGLLVCSLLTGATLKTVLAEEHIIRAVGMAYKPMVVFAQPGDTIKWVKMDAHNTESIEGMVPEGAEHWRSEMSADFHVTLDKEGVYIYRCAPHIGLGMGGAIIVGEPVNLEAVVQAAPKNPLKRIVKKAKKAIEKAAAEPVSQ